MNREFIVNLLILLGINLLIKPLFILGVDLRVQNAVGVEQYGMYFALLSLTYLLQMVNDFGIQNFNSKTISQDNSLLDVYVPNLFFIKTILAIAYLLFTFLMGCLLRYPPDYFYLLFWLATNQVLVSFILYLRTNIQGIGKYRLDSFLSALDRFLSIIFCSILLYFGFFQKNQGIEYFVYAQTVALSLSFLIAFSLVFKELKHPQWTFDWRFLGDLLKKSYPFALIALLMTLYTRSDSVLLERLLPDGKMQTGIYASAYRLLDALNSIGLLFGGLLLPMFAKTSTQRGGEKQTENPAFLQLLHLSTRLILVGGITVVVAVYGFQQEIAHFLYHQATDVWGHTLGILILCFVPICFMYVAGALLTAKDCIWEMIYIFALAAVLNAGLNYFFIRHYQAEGAAIATVLTQFFVAFALGYQMQRIGLGVSTRLLLQLFALLFLEIACCWLLKTTTSLDWKLLFFLVLGSGIVGALALRLLRVQDLRF
jgi:O-antigen/teichoic acid export membrane protein